MSELHAAVGLCILDDIDAIVERRLECAALYRRLLADHVAIVTPPDAVEWNGGYMPVLLESRARRDEVRGALKDVGVEGRPYFFPALNYAFGVGADTDTPIAKDASERILCLPIFDGLAHSDVTRIADVVCAHC
jgi:dTDP-4-amino-4,6-dideoxygalactose transaminase